MKKKIKIIGYLKAVVVFTILITFILPSAAYTPQYNQQGNIKNRLPDIQYDPVASDPDLAVSADGTIHVVWQDYRYGSRGAIFYARSIDDGASFTQQCISMREDSDERDPAVAVDGDNVYIAWSQIVGSENSISYRRSEDGGLTFSPIRTLYTQTNWGDHTLDMAVKDNYVYVTPTYNLASFYNTILCLVSDDFGDNFELRSEPWPGGFYPGNSWIATDAAGNPYITCVLEEPWNYYTYIEFYKSEDHGYNWQELVTVSGSCHVHSTPSIAVSDDGNQIGIVWHEEYFQQDRIIYSKSTNGGQSFDPEEIVDDGNQPAITPACLSGTGLDVVWTVVVDPSTFAIYFDKKDDFNSYWQQDKFVCCVGNVVAVQPQVERLEGSNIVHVVWTHIENQEMNICYKNSTDGGNSWPADYKRISQPTFIQMIALQW
jgi:hypothetical protein